MGQVPAWGTIPRMLRDQAARRGDALAVADGPIRLRLGQLRRQATEGARALIAMGVQPGDRVAIMIPNGFRWVISAFAVWDTGAVIVPVPAGLTGAQARQVLEKTQASVLLTCDDVGRAAPPTVLAQACGEPIAGRPYAGLPDLRTVVVFGDLPTPRTAHEARRPGTWRLHNFLAQGASVAPRVAEQRALAVQSADLCEILSTPGADGGQSCVMLDHAQLLRASWDWSEIATLDEGDRFPAIAPFSHWSGLNAGLLACVLKGATILPVAAFDPAALTDLIDRQQASLLAGPPSLFYRLLNQPPRTPSNLSSLRVATCGAPGVPPELIGRLLAETGVRRVINSYGLIESPLVAMTRADDPIDVIAATVGRAVPGMVVKIVDAAGAEVPTAMLGEIVVGGYGVMRGYWQDGEQTARALDADGFLHTGDIGMLDDRGNLAIVDRKRDVFIVAGLYAYPAEIEALLLFSGGLAHAAVIGVLDPVLGEVGWAFVVPRPGAVVDAGALISWARRNMADHQVPRRIIIVDSLPLNPDGDIDKDALRRRASASEPAASLPHQRP